MDISNEKHKNFLSMKTRKDVANILNIDDKSLRYFLYKRKTENLYNTFEILKKNGDPREICSPCKELKNIQKKLAYLLNEIYTPKVCAYGFIKDKNILENAQNHCKKHIIFNLDLKDFFSQIHFGRIRGLFLKSPYNIGKEAATTIAQLVCYEGKLPQGAPTSPILTNMICAPLDNNLMRLAKKTRCKYTRYADDITFSSFNNVFPPEIVKVNRGEITIGESLRDILTQHSFEVNYNKITLSYKYNRQEVTGLTVNTFPNVRRSYLKHVRAILHHCQINGLYATGKEYIEKGYCKNSKIKVLANNKEHKEEIEEWFIQVLKGKIQYIKQIKGEKNLTFLSYGKKLNEVANESVFDISELLKLDEIAQKSVVVLIYESESTFLQGSGFYLEGYGLVTSYHVTESGDFFKVNKVVNKNLQLIANISQSTNSSHNNKDIDYIVYKDSSNQVKPLKLGDSKILSIGDTVIIIGYPNYAKGNSCYIQECKITSSKFFMGAMFYTVSGRICHGASGGVVLNKEHRVIGIIKGGIESLDGDENINQGFVPIHLMVNDINSKKLLNSE